MNEIKNEMEQVSNMFADYEKRSNPTSKQRKFENILTKYFNARNPKEIFRILPPNNGEKLIETAYFHRAQINTHRGVEYKTYLCLGKNNYFEEKLDAEGNKVLDQEGNVVKVTVDCPFCKEQERLLAMQDKSILSVDKLTYTPEQTEIAKRNTELFKESNKYKADLYYIVPGIDRLSERDGKKFWRFRDRYQKNGIIDKMIPVLEDFVNEKEVSFANPENGADLSITVVDASLPNGRKYKDVSAISVRAQSPLHSDPKIAEQFLNDDTSWREVFKPAVAPNITPSHFLELVIKNQTPYYDDSNPKDKRWIFPGNPELEALAKRKRDEMSRQNTNINSSGSIEDMNSRIGNLTKEDAGVYKQDFVDMTAQSETPSVVQQPTTTPPTQQIETQQSEVVNDEYDDLPF